MKPEGVRAQLKEIIGELQGKISESGDYTLDSNPPRISTEALSLQD
jgi:hypothetical protein